MGYYVPVLERNYFRPYKNKHARRYVSVLITNKMLKIDLQNTGHCK